MLAVKDVLSGTEPGRAAKKVKASRSSVERWLREAKRSGISGLVRNRYIERRMRKLNFAELRVIREEIAAALNRKPSWRVQKRLRALDAILAGRTVSRAADTACASRPQVERWLAAATRHGLGGMLSAHERPRKETGLALDSAMLRALAATEKNWRMKKRLLAMADIAEGMSITRVSMRVGAGEDTIAKWIERFRAGGAEALRGKQARGRPTRLTRDQLKELQDILRTRPDASYPELCETMRTRFGVSYAPPGLKRLVKVSFGPLARTERAPLRI